MTVSESTAASSIVAVGRWGSRPWLRKRSTTSVAVLPTGSNVAATGKRVSIEPMWWWSRISTMWASPTPGTLWACSAWSTSSTSRGARVDQLGPGHDAHRAPRCSSTAMAAL